jgi:OFA family oxalate/formate antiporter-like MFS transporter
VLAAGLALQMAFGLVFAWGEVAPYVRAVDHWPPWLLGAVFSGTPLGYGTGTLVGGRLADRLPPRRLCWAGLGLLAVGLAVAFTLPSGFTFVAFYAFLGLGVGGGVALTGTVAALVQVFPERSGTMAGAATAAYAVSAIFQAPALGALIPHLGWLGAFRVVGLASLLPGLALLALMPPLPAPRLAALGEKPASVRELLSRRAVWTGCLLVFSGAVLGPYAAVALAADVISSGLGPILATAAVVVFAAGNASGRLMAGVASDGLGTRPVILIVLVLEAVAAILLFAGIGPLTAPAAALAAGLSLGGSNGVMGRLAVQAAPKAPNSAFGILFAAFAAGAVVGPIGGALTGGRAAWLLVGAPALLGFAVLGFRSRLLEAS